MVQHLYFPTPTLAYNPILVGSDTPPKPVGQSKGKGREHVVDKKPSRHGQSFHCPSAGFGSLMLIHCVQKLSLFLMTKAVRRPRAVTVALRLSASFPRPAPQNVDEVCIQPAH